MSKEQTIKVYDPIFRQTFYCTAQENMATINAVDCDGKPCGVFEHLENGEWVE